jgi:hypothetical protein
MISYRDAVILSKNKVLIKVHVVPGSSQSVFPAGYNSWRRCILVKLRAEADGNRANDELVDLVAGYFNVSRKDIYIADGQRNRYKTVAVMNVSFYDVCSKIEGSLDELSKIS